MKIFTVMLYSNEWSEGDELCGLTTNTCRRKLTVLAKSSKIKINTKW